MSSESNSSGNNTLDRLVPSIAYNDVNSSSNNSIHKTHKSIRSTAAAPIMRLSNVVLNNPSNNTITTDSSSAVLRSVSTEQEESHKQMLVEKILKDFDMYRNYCMNYGFINNRIPSMIVQQQQQQHQQSYCVAPASAATAAAGSYKTSVLMTLDGSKQPKLDEKTIKELLEEYNRMTNSSSSSITSNPVSNPVNDFFDRVFCLNLHRRPDRMIIAHKRFEYVGIQYERFNALDGSIMNVLWKGLNNKLFKNTSYVGCCLSHLSIYKEALERGYERILIVEDDNRIHRNVMSLFKEHVLDKFGPVSSRSNNQNNKTKSKELDLLHLAYIPLTDDTSMWSYAVLTDCVIEPNLYKSKNMWSLMAYGISARLMRHLLNVYNESFPMELDRFFVTNIMHNPDFVCRAVYPQLFIAEDNWSDNTDTFTPDLMRRSIDPNHSKPEDYV